MSEIQGKVREVQDYGKSIGVFEAEVLAINPNMEELTELLNGYEIEEEPKYFGVKDITAKWVDEKGEEQEETLKDVRWMRISVYLKSVKTNRIFSKNFFIEDRERENKTRTNSQWINTSGALSWSKDKKDLFDWFKDRDFRKALVGEEELYGFLRAWISGLDYRDDSTKLYLDLKKLFSGNVSELTAIIKSEQKLKDAGKVRERITGTVVALAEVNIKETDEGKKEYQNIWRKFLPGYTIKHFRNTSFTDEKLEELRKRGKVKKDLKPFEKFVVEVTDSENGSKNIFSLKEIHDYNENDYLQATDKTIDATDASY